MLLQNFEIKSKISNLWNKFWSGGISNPITAIEQISYLIFLKKMDDLDKEKLSFYELNEKEYTSIYQGEIEINGVLISKEKLRWSYLKELESDKKIDYMQNYIFPYLKVINNSNDHFLKYMKNAVFVISKTSLLEDGMEIIDDIFDEMKKDSTNNSQAIQDIQGDVYEYLLNEISSAGKNGQFRTPRHIIKLVTSLVEPKVGQKIVDPACGSGGFLLGAYEFILDEINKSLKKETKKLLKMNHLKDKADFEIILNQSIISNDMIEVVEDNLYGFDIDVTMVRLGLMNLLMHGINNSKIEYSDTLSKNFNNENAYDIVLGNPPFTGSIDKSDINSSLKIKTTKTEILFIEKILNMLKIGGTAGVIVPQGILFASGKQYKELRKLLLEHTEIKAIINMPSGVFKPYTGVSTAIIIFRKGAETKNVWFYDMQNDGYSLDDKRIQKQGSELEEIINRFKNRHDEYKENDRSKQYFTVPKDEIIENDYDFSLVSYKDSVLDELDIREYKKIISDIQNIDDEINRKFKELRSVLNDLG